MARRDVIVMGASAGGVEALRSVVAGLPPDLDAAVFVVLHLPRTAPSALTLILSRATSLPVSTAVDGDPIHPGRIYVAPVDHHLLLIQGRTRLSRGPTENGHRPAIDPLFRSAALAFSSRVIGVVLSGSRDDGAAGMAAIARSGGLTIVQDPDDAPHPSMPNAAIAAARIDHICPVGKIGPLLGELVEEQAPHVETAAEPLLEAELEISQTVPDGEETIGHPAGLGCPACGGSLFEVEGSPAPRYRCRVGHAWSPESLLEEQSSALESALWMALRALADKAALGRRIAENFQGSRYASTRERFEMLAGDADRATRLIRDLLDRIGGVETEGAAEGLVASEQREEV
jgi:two-component system, chemotaxis family, protein-glutamate methylesterase/glutaminase